MANNDLGISHDLGQGARDYEPYGRECVDLGPCTGSSFLANDNLGIFDLGQSA